MGNQNEKNRRSKFFSSALNTILHPSKWKKTIGSLGKAKTWKGIGREVFHQGALLGHEALSEAGKAGGAKARILTELGESGLTAAENWVHGQHSKHDVIEVAKKLAPVLHPHAKKLIEKGRSTYEKIHTKIAKSKYGPHIRAMVESEHGKLIRSKIQQKLSGLREKYSKHIGTAESIQRYVTGQGNSVDPRTHLNKGMGSQLAAYPMGEPPHPLTMMRALEHSFRAQSASATGGPRPSILGAQQQQHGSTNITVEHFRKLAEQQKRTRKPGQPQRLLLSGSPSTRKRKSNGEQIPKRHRLGMTPGLYHERVHF